MFILLLDTVIAIKLPSSGSLYEMSERKTSQVDA